MSRLKKLKSKFENKNKFIGFYLTEQQDNIFFDPVLNYGKFWPKQTLNFANGDFIELNGKSPKDRLSHLQGISELGESIGSAKFIRAIAPGGHEIYFTDIDRDPISRLIFDVNGDFSDKEIYGCGENLVNIYMKKMQSALDSRGDYIDRLIKYRELDNENIELILKSAEENSRFEQVFYHDGMKLGLKGLDNDQKNSYIRRSKFCDITSLGNQYNQKAKYNEIISMDYFIWNVLDNIFENQVDLLELDVNYLKANNHEEKADELQGVISDWKSYSSKAYRVKEMYGRIWESFSYEMKELGHKFVYSKEFMDDFFNTVTKAPQKEDYRLTFNKNQE